MSEGSLTILLRFAGNQDLNCNLGLKYSNAHFSRRSNIKASKDHKDSDYTFSVRKCKKIMIHQYVERRLMSPNATGKAF